MKVEYIGPHDEVEVPALNLIFAKGKAVEVKAADAERLLEQATNFKRASEPKPAKEADK